MNIPGLGNFDLPFNIPGKLSKMKIYGYTDGTMKEQVPGSPIAVLINPESYSHDYKLKYVNLQAPGNSQANLKYELTAPLEMNFEFLFDHTGIIDGLPKNDISGDLEVFKKVVFEFKGNSHQAPFVKLVWGDENGLFKGRLSSMNIHYKLFSPDGKPLRAIVKVNFVESVRDTERAAKENKNSPDLTHIRIVKAGDTLPLMCEKIYDDPKYYLQVARYNNLSNFRSLKPGMEIVFPPIEKTEQSSETK